MIKVAGSATANPALGQPVWTTSVFFRWPGVHFREEYIWHNELSAAK